MALFSRTGPLDKALRSRVLIGLSPALRGTEIGAWGAVEPLVTGPPGGPDGRLSPNACERDDPRQLDFESTELRLDKRDQYELPLCGGGAPDAGGSGGTTDRGFSGSGRRSDVAAPALLFTGADPAGVVVDTDEDARVFAGAKCALPDQKSRGLAEDNDWEDGATADGFRGPSGRPLSLALPIAPCCDGARELTLGAVSRRCLDEGPPRGDDGGDDATFTGTRGVDDVTPG